MTANATRSQTITVAGAPPIPGLVFRAYAADDLAALAGLIEAIEIADGTFEIPGEAALANELANLADFEPERDILVAEVDGRLVAASRQTRMIRDGTREFGTSGWVHPEWRRRGLGRAMLRYGEAELRRRSAAEGAAGDTRPAHLSAWCFEGAAGAVALFTAEGYVPVRWYLEMARTLAEPIGEPHLPADVERRPVEAAQVRAILLADDEAFEDHWAHRELTEADIRRTLGDPDCDLSLWQVAWAGDEVVGSVQSWIYPTDNAAMGRQRGWLDRVSVRRAWRGQGVATALIQWAMLALRDRGMELAMLGVDADNPTGAVGVYERLGFRTERRSATYRKPL